jgi:hypothetical protein
MDVPKNPIWVRSYRAIGWLFILAMVALHLFFLWNVRDRIVRGDPDFTVFYTAGKILRDGHGTRLYDPHTQQSAQSQFTADSDIRRGPLPYIHPPFEALVFLPLTLFSYSTAFVIWEILNIGVLLGVALILKDTVEVLRGIPAWTLLFSMLALFPIFATFHQGQDAILLLLVLVLGYRALNRKADFLAGCWIGFGVFKYHLILPVILVLVIWRGRKPLLGFVTVAFCLALMSLALVGWHASLAYPAYALHIASNAGFGGIPTRQLPNLWGLLAGWPFAEGVGWPLQVLILACAAGLLAWMAGLKPAAQDDRFFRLCLSCAVIAAVLVAYNTNTYDLSLLVLPLVLVGDYCVRNLSGHSRRRWALVLPAIPLLISPLWFFLWLRWSRVNLMAIFLLWWLFALTAEIARARSIAPATAAEAALD